MNKTSKNLFKFSATMFAIGKTLTTYSNSTDNAPLVENYNYIYPFRLPQLHSPVYGNTFKFHKTKGSMNVAQNYANKVRRTIEAQEGITLLPVECINGASVITMKFRPMNNIKKAYSLDRQIKYALDSEEARISKDGAKVVVEMPFKGSTVYFGDFMYDNAYKMQTSKTIVPIGQDAKGNNIYGDLAKMPHMLVAGTTGSGKSVFLNGLITSLLMRNTPDDLQLFLIDPKMVEFRRFSRLHYVKYVTDTQKAINLLSKLCKEMDNRYAIMANAGCRDIDDFNKRNPQNRLPKMVLVIDEMADMMEGKSGKMVESNIVRLAQKARACGIHMVLATQRPTVKVISGQIKANIPCRVCLSVMSRTDSMVVLDQIGAENLQGHGDMLYLDGMNNRRPQRLQGGLITDSEICNVVMDLDFNNQHDTTNEQLAELGKDFLNYYGR